MSTWSRALLFCSAIALSFSASADVSAAPKDDPVVVKVSQATNDLHSVFMAVKLATVTARRGHPTTLFVNLEAVRLFVKSQPAELRWGTMESSLSDMLDAYAKAGGKILVCPHCAKAAGIDAKQLAHGARLASADQVGDLFSAAGKVIDY